MTDNEQPDIALAGVSRTYGSTRALIDADLPLHRGRVAALLGENGAGKSTAAKILCGLETPDTGQVLIDGAPVTIAGPRGAHALGIYLIPQELAFVPDLTVAENITLGWAPHRHGLTSRRSVIAAAQAQADRFGFDLSMRQKMRDLALADVQMVEILKALRIGARAIVLDEPTSSLTEDESARLFAAVRRLAADGTSVTFVSHRLDEVLDGSDQVHVFRDGRIVETVQTAETTREELLESMLGRPFQVSVGQRKAGADRAVGLGIQGWRSGTSLIEDTSLDFLAGEVTVLYGLRGSGSDLLAEGLAGARPAEHGSMSVDGTVVGRPRGPKQARRSGIAYVPPDRRRQGLMMHLSVEENLVLHVRGRTSAGMWRRPRAEARLAREAIAAYRIRVASPRQLVSELSGGNQQKVLLAGRLGLQPRVLVLQEPTRGVDIGARDEIHRILRDYAQQGATAIVSTSDFEEALQLADRMLVFRHGRVVGDLRGDAMTTALNLAKGSST
ncbi:sugar ABC transporter ATP-binding protein [Amycolatopsis sp. GM8]|uniref:sugar ABC transporter ATP-binding protein n=1 Tax=Amycolatopsis sp. GM8 TaxID=2896530 RepID=UPI001F279BBD|nr:sugar ABC transporter ATP-binding protein [Amycolatopsis sp. GM8]